MTNAIDIRSPEILYMLKEIRRTVIQSEILKQVLRGKLVGTSAQLAWLFIRENPLYLSAFKGIDGKSKSITIERIKSEFGVSKPLDPSIVTVDSKFEVSAPPAVLARVKLYKEINAESFCGWAVPKMTLLSATFPNSDHVVRPLVVVINQTAKTDRIISSIREILNTDEFREHKLSRRYSLIGKELSVDSLLGAIVCHYGKSQGLRHKEIEFVFKGLLHQKHLTHNQCKIRERQFSKLSKISPWFFFSPTRKK
jgi:hypothetical protein